MESMKNRLYGNNSKNWTIRSQASLILNKVKEEGSETRWKSVLSVYDKA